MSRTVIDEPAPPSSDHPAGVGVIKPGYHPRLTNDDLAPLRDQNWTWYNIFAFWMSDVHSVGGYVTAGSLFALGLTSWQVFICLIVGISIVLFFANLVAKPSQRTGVPFPVICRSVFGVVGANIPAIIRGLIAVAWYGIQTYLASSALDILRRSPVARPRGVRRRDPARLPRPVYLGYVTFAILWVLQAAVFWTGMDTIRKFIDFCGPAVYVVMFLLCGYLLVKADFERQPQPVGPAADRDCGASRPCALRQRWSSPTSPGRCSTSVTSPATARPSRRVKRGNFWGLPVNFTMFSVLTVLTAAATLPVYGELITDPVQTVGKIDNTFAIVLAALTFTTATIGINIVANFVSPAFDFSHVSPQRISWRTGGMIAAVGSVLITPWNLYKNPDTIHYTLDTLGAFIGPLFGVLICHYYLVHHQKVAIDDLFTMDESGVYHYRKGFNPAAVWATAIAGAVAVCCVFVPGLDRATDYSWFIGCGLGLAVYYVLARVTGVDKTMEGREGSDVVVG